jgi:Mycothiol maleylpyruvate isomerase N-terminal domain
VTRVEELARALDAARDDFAQAVDAVDIELVRAPGIVGDWSVRDLVVHVAFWCEHGSEALRLAAIGRGAEFDYDSAQTDRMNADLEAEARRTSPTAAAEREEAAYGAFRDAIAGLDPTLLSLRLGNGDTVEEVIRYDGPGHYAEHTAQIRAWFGTDGEDQEEDAEP